MKRTFDRQERGFCKEKKELSTEMLIDILPFFAEKHVQKILIYVGRHRAHATIEALLERMYYAEEAAIIVNRVTAKGKILKESTISTKRKALAKEKERMKKILEYFVEENGHSLPLKKVLGLFPEPQRKKAEQLLLVQTEEELSALFSFLVGKLVEFDEKAMKGDEEAKSLFLPGLFQRLSIDGLQNLLEHGEIDAFDPARESGEEVQKDVNSMFPGRHVKPVRKIASGLAEKEGDGAHTKLRY